MKSISAEKHSSVVSLLNEGYPHCQIQARMGLRKGTISRISRVEGDKENHPGGRPSKLSPCNKQSIICQIRSGKLDNTVQATQFINSTTSNSVTPQTVRNVLKEAGFRSATKKKVPMLKRSHCQQYLKFAQYHGNWTVEDWKKVLWTDETKINRIGSDGKVYVWKQQEEPVTDRTTTPTIKHGGGNNLMIWGCMSGDTPFPTSAVPVSTQPLGQKSTPLFESELHSALLFELELCSAPISKLRSTLKSELCSTFTSRITADVK